MQVCQSSFNLEMLIIQSLSFTISYLDSQYWLTDQSTSPHIALLTHLSGWYNFNITLRHVPVLMKCFYDLNDQSPVDSDSFEEWKVMLVQALLSTMPSVVLRLPSCLEWIQPRVAMRLLRCSSWLLGHILSTLKYLLYSSL